MSTYDIDELVAEETLQAESFDESLEETVEPFKEKKPLEGQAALVTGANSGIGVAIVKELAAAGADVVVNYVHNAYAADQIVDEITELGGQAIAIRADVSKEEQGRPSTGHVPADHRSLWHAAYSGQQCQPAAGRGLSRNDPR